MKSNLVVNMVVASAAILVVVLASLLTVYVMNQNNQSGGGSGAQGYQNVTFTDAVLNCRTRVKRLYGERIQTLTTDNHSSHFSESRFQFKIFLTMDTYNPDKTTTEHFINCFVRSKNGAIAKFEVFENKEGKAASVIDDGTNMFGIKKSSKK